MKKFNGYSPRDAGYINELYLLLKKETPLDRIADWLAINGLRYNNQMVQKTFKIAGKSDLAEYFIQEADIKIGDTVKSRWSGRIGKVIGINKDDFDITVHWETGGKQKIAKESVFKLRTSEITSINDIQKPNTPTDDYPASPVKSRN